MTVNPIKVWGADLRDKQVLLTDDRTPGVEYVLTIDNGHCVRLEMQRPPWLSGPPHADTALTARALREVRFGALEREALATLQLGHDRLAVSDMAGLPEQLGTYANPVPGLLRSVRESLGEQRRPGRAGRPLRDLAGVAAAYVAVAATPRAVAKVAEQLHFRPGSIYNMLQAAAKADLLTGYPGPMARLTTKAQDLLRETH